MEASLAILLLGIGGIGEGSVGDPSRNNREMDWCGWTDEWDVEVETVVLLRVRDGNDPIGKRIVDRGETGPEMIDLWRSAVCQSHHGTRERGGSRHGFS